MESVWGAGAVTLRIHSLYPIISLFCQSRWRINPWPFFVHPYIFLQKSNLAYVSRLRTQTEFKNISVGRTSPDGNMANPYGGTFE